MKALKVAGLGVVLALVFLGVLTLEAGPQALPIAQTAWGMVPDGLLDFPLFWIPAAIGLGISLYKHRFGPALWGILLTVVGTYLFSVFIVFSKQ